jgi:hypothetical protein
VERWLFNLAGFILFLVFLGFEALCGQASITPSPPRGTYDDPIPDIHTSTFGVPTVLEITDDPARAGRIGVYPMNCVLVFVGGYFASMVIGRLALDGGAGRIERTLMPRRRNPAIWLLGYIAGVPLLALAGAFRDLRQGGLRGLFSPTGPANYPLMVLALALLGVPLVAVALAIRGVIDRRNARRVRSFRTNATPKPEIPWPFDPPAFDPPPDDWRETHE